MQDNRRMNQKVTYVRLIALYAGIYGNLCYINYSIFKHVSSAYGKWNSRDN